ncbi:MAG: transglycosylase SLT domain-containing protein [Bacteroidia bacterium]|nr:transglycosylase SLT domain-containing protein [Bacteroidia bacterium]
MLRYLFGSLLLLVVSLASAFSQDSFSEEIIEIVRINDSSVQRVILDKDLHRERWDTLAQVRFWRKVMNLPPEYSVLNIADTRNVLNTFQTAYYDTLEDPLKRSFKDSILQICELPSNTRLYVTYGKSDFYKLREVLPSIDAGIRHFQAEGTDPWFAQSILLIESPGQLRKSPTGAVGHFQLMPGVGRQMGLKVNREVDEREDFEKSARAAARFIKKVCIPETKDILRSYRLSFKEDDLWFRLMVLHVYHAGSGNVRSALRLIRPRKGGMALIQSLWQTRNRYFRNASQNYSQVALASLLELEEIIRRECNVLCPPIR